MYDIEPTTLTTRSRHSFSTDSCNLQSHGLFNSGANLLGLRISQCYARPPNNRLLNIKCYDLQNNRWVIIVRLKGDAHDLFKSYLDNWKQMVTFNNCESEEKVVEIGVPQGSVLGLILLNTTKDCNTAKDDKGPQIDVLNTAKNDKGP